MKTLIYISLVLVFCFANNLFADVYWDKTFGGENYETGYSVAVCSDGGYIITGFVENTATMDVWLVKTDNLGNLQWDKTFGGTGNEVGDSIAICNDGGFIILGDTDSYGAGSTDFWLIKTDASGNKMWDKTFGGTLHDSGYSVAVCDDGSFILTGYTFSYGAGDADAWLIKTDANGNELWDKTFGGIDRDHGYSVATCSDSGFVIAGDSRSYNEGYSPDVWLIKTDANGNKQWDKTFGGSEWDEGRSVAQCSDGGFILTGEVFSSITNSDDVYLVKTDANGNKLWDKTFGGIDSDQGNSVAVCDDNGYVITGQKDYSYWYTGDLWLIKTDAAGNKQWEFTINGNDTDCGNFIAVCNDNSYIITGNTYSFGAGYSDLWLIYYKSEYEASISDLNLLSVFLIILSLSSLLFLKRKEV